MVKTDKDKDPIAILIGKQIKQYRSAKKLKQEELAEMAGVTTQHISQLESGRSRPSFESLSSIANALNVLPNELLADIIEVDNSDYLKLMKYISLLGLEGQQLAIKLIEPLLDYNLIKK